MTKHELIAKLHAHEGWVPGKRIRVDFGSEGSILADGVQQSVSDAADAADTIIGISWTDWQALSDGRLDPMGAFMSGRLRVQGDISDAVQLGSRLKDLRS
ncbi:MAG: SCP2 sterol-binding domain-containing protein [Sphingomicrobium sp.]